MAPRRKASVAPISGTVRVGIGGWTYAPWRGVFYPEGLARVRELHFASRALTSIEVNGTFYRAQKPSTFAAWSREVPDGFQFALKAPRYATHRRVLAEAGPSIDRFIQSGIAELGDRLGPLLWQFPPTTRFDESDFASFLSLLPGQVAGRDLRHAVEVRHPSFSVPSFVHLARRYSVAIVYADHASYPAISDVTADFVYARLQRGRERLTTGYPPPEIEAWAARLLTWASGSCPPDLPAIASSPPAAVEPRDVFAYVIHEAKLRAPAAAGALIERLQSG